jgi:hypothetical protein
MWHHGRAGFPETTETRGAKGEDVALGTILAFWLERLANLGPGSLASFRSSSSCR